jgi:hypothetical protein
MLHGHFESEVHLYKDTHYIRLSGKKNYQEALKLKVALN